MTGFKLMVPLSTFGEITNQKIQTRHYQSTTGPLDKRLVLSRAEAMSGHPLRRLLCRFSDAGMTMLSARCGGRRPKSAKARNRGKCGTQRCRGRYRDLAAVRDLSAG